MMKREKPVCPECKKEDPDLIEDHAAGDLICRDCGTVVGEHIVDMTSEWRTFANDSNSHDPVRVGAPTNHLFQDGGLSTIIGTGKKNDAAANNLSRWQSRGSLSSTDRTLRNAFQEISRMADQIELQQTIKDRANELYKQVITCENGSIRGRSNEGIIAASLYFACLLENVPRTFKEICSLTNVGTKEIGKSYKFMRKHLSLTSDWQAPKVVGTDDFMNRFCTNLRLSVDVQQAASHVATMATELNLVAGKRPTSVAAAGIYLVTQLTSNKKSAKEIAVVAGVAEGTIKNAYKDLYPRRHDLVPAGFSNHHDIDSLPAT